MQEDVKLTQRFVLSFSNYFFRFKTPIVDSSYKIEHKAYLLSLVFVLKVKLTFYCLYFLAKFFTETYSDD